ncbi:MAG: helix-turn-helix domain-containing protein [Bdellovibrionales bacterium]
MKRRPRKASPFGKILTELMVENKIGVREAARIAGVGASTIVSWRGGALPEDYLAVKNLATAFGTTLGFLLTGEPDSRPEGSMPSVAEVFSDGGMLFDGFAKITIQRLIPKGEKK